MLKKLLLFGFAGLGVFTIGILIGHFGINKGSSAPLPGWVQEVNKDVDESFIQKFIAEVDNMNIQENLRVLTRVPHMATSAGDEATVDYMLKRWHDKDSGLDAAWREDYRVYLSFPDKDKPNKVSVVNSSDVVLYTAREKEKPYFADQEDPDIVQPFAAFGPAGHAKGKLVYANQGKTSDYEHLFKTLGDLNDTIAIVRYGGAGRVDKGINAAHYGVTGVLVYTDPYDINDGLMSDKNETYPHSWYLPPSGVERGGFSTNIGDPLTPYLAAKSKTGVGINAAPYGVAGVLVYTEPYDINDGLMSDKNETYPHSWYLPPSGVERGSYKVNFGDQLTPYLAAKNGTYRIEDKDISGLSPIPIQPIGFEDAQALICNLGGSAAPADWQGSFPCTYNFGGPGFSNASDFKDSDVKLDVYNKRSLEDSANVMGVIWGSVEPDRYVIYGNHRDSWVHGAVDPSSGTSVMLEISRILGQRVKSGKWRPRRTIIFGSWGAEEFGLIGSVEYAEEYITKLSQRTVAYINVDISVFANATLQASATPIAQNVIFTASKEVKIPGSDSVSVYKNWMQYSNRTSPTYGTIPNMRYLTGAGSDYAGFIHYLGITSMDISYTYDKSKTRARIYPAYHTAYDTFNYVDRFIDPGFTSHQTVARTAGNILIRLADSMLLPFNCSDYAETLEQYLTAAEQNFEEQLKNNSIPMEPLKEAVRSFRTAASSLDKIIHASDFVNNSPLKARKINDQLMLLDRAFLNPLAFPNKYGFRHVIWASRSSSVATFPGLADAVEKASKSGLKEDWAQAHRHLSIVTQAVSGAAHTLSEAHSQL